MNLLAKITPQQKNLIIISLILGVTFGLGGVYYFSFYKVKAKEITKLTEELEKKERELENIRFLFTEVAGKEQTKKKRKAELRRLEKGLPEVEYVPTLLTEIENLAAETHSQVSSLSPGQIASPASQATPQGETAAPAVVYKEMSLSIPFRGSYQNLKDFLNRLATFPMVIVVNNLAISKAGEADAYDATPILSVSLPTTIYILPKGERGGKTGS